MFCYFFYWLSKTSLYIYCRTVVPPRPLILRACASNPDHDRLAASQEAEAEDSEIHEVVEKRPKCVWEFVSHELINAISGMETFALFGMCIGYKNWVKQYPILPILLSVSVIALKYALYKKVMTPNK
ncbi:hypothetical protein Hanom_Chr11g01046221 [Helianthus anomalus]